MAKRLQIFIQATSNLGYGHSLCKKIHQSIWISLMGRPMLCFSPFCEKASLATTFEQKLKRWWFWHLGPYSHWQGISWHRSYFLDGLTLTWLGESIRPNLTQLDLTWPDLNLTWLNRALTWRPRLYLNHSTVFALSSHYHCQCWCYDYHKLLCWDHLMMTILQLCSSITIAFYFLFKSDLNPKVDTPLFTTNSNPLQL